MLENSKIKWVKWIFGVRDKFIESVIFFSFCLFTGRGEGERGKRGVKFLQTKPVIINGLQLWLNSHVQGICVCIKATT